MGNFVVRQGTSATTTALLSSHLRRNVGSGDKIKPNALSTLYALRDRRGPKGSADLKTRHSAGETCRRDIITNEVKNRGLRIRQVLHVQEWISLGHMALTLRLAALNTRSRGSAVNVYICQGSLMSTVLRRLLLFSVHDRFKYNLLRYMPSFAEAILDPDGIGIAIWYFGSSTFSEWATYPTFSG